MTSVLDTFQRIAESEHKIGGDEKNQHTRRLLVAVGGTLAMSFGLILLIERPLEKLRRPRAGVIQAPAAYPDRTPSPPVSSSGSRR